MTIEEIRKAKTDLMEMGEHFENFKMNFLHRRNQLVLLFNKEEARLEVEAELRERTAAILKEADRDAARAETAENKEAKEKADG